MFRKLPYLIPLLLGFSGEAVAEAFRVLAPDRQNQQVISVMIRATDNHVTMARDQAIRLPFRPSGITLHPDNAHVYVTATSNSLASVCQIELQKDGTLQLGETSQLPHPTGYTSVDRSGQFFLSANYRSGTLSVYRLNPQKTVGPLVCALNTPLKEAHCILTTPNNDFVYVPCVKLNNALYQFGFDEETGMLRPLAPFDAKPPAMFGPRHVAYHPSLPIAYFSNEQQLGVSAYEMDGSGQLNERQHIGTMPRRGPYVPGQRGLHASDLVLSPDGSQLMVAVRDFVGDEDSVFRFLVDTDGKLTWHERTPVGDIPWKLDLSPSGRYLLVSESAAGHLSIFDTQPATGMPLKGTLKWAMGVRDMVVVRAD